DSAAGLEAVCGLFDRREMRPMPEGLDAAWLAAGDPAFEILWPRLGVRAAARVASDAPAWIVAASPPDLYAVAIEPQTHAAYGLERFLARDPGRPPPPAPGPT